MSADTFLSHLEQVRRTGTGRWIACCPAHDDHHPSLSVRELDDGRVLLHCFAGCAVHDVVAAIGMQEHDLFPAQPIEHGNPERRSVPAADILRCIAGEATFVYLVARAIVDGIAISSADRERLQVACSRIGAAADHGRANHA